ncbi:MAG: hypothetical protein AB7S68_09565, partial [Polyangiaceae bacterium]
EVNALVQRVDGQFVDVQDLSVGGDGNQVLGGDTTQSIGDEVPVGLSGYTAVLSANERALFTIGGTQGNSPLKIRRLSTLPGPQAWEELDFEGTFGRMLAATYRAGNRQLVTLDETGGYGRLRLFDLQSTIGLDLGTWPVSGSVSRVYLVPTADRGVLLVATKNGSFRAAKFTVVEGQAAVEWHVFGGGTVVARPRLGSKGLDLTLVDGNGVRIATRVLPSQFVAGGSLGTCLQ